MDEFLTPKHEIDSENFTDVIDEIDESVDDGTGLGTAVVLFDDNYHTFNQVMSQLTKAIGCSDETAFYHANKVHTTGKSTVYKGKIERCLTVSSILREINLKTQIVS